MRPLPGCSLLFCVTVSLTAQVSAPVDLASAVVERGPHHQVIEIIRRSEDASIVTNRFTQLGTQLNRLDPKTGDYVPAVARWDQTPEGYFVSVETAHQVILAPRLLTDSAVDVLSSDGARVQCTPLCLLYVSGDDSVLLGTIQDRPAERLSDTEVIYRDVFGEEDPVRADYRVRIDLDRVEGDLILRTGLPDPKARGWSPDGVRVVMVTEAFEGTAPTIVERESDVPGLRFGNLELAPGKAFALGADPATEDVPVTSTWSEKDGRKLLYEATKFTPLVPLLESLPAVDQARILAKDRRLLAGQVPSPVRRPHAAPKPTVLASLSRPAGTAQPAVNGGLDPAPGVVLDWTLLASQSALTLAGNVTHLLQNAVNVTSLTIEPCCVVKSTNNGLGRIYVSGSDNRIGFFAGNVLMVNVGTAFTGYSYNGTVQHLTADGVTLLANASTYYGPGGLWVRNSILANVTTFQGQAVTLSGSGYNGFYNGSPTPPTFGSPTFPVSANPFVTVGAGGHYLAPISPFWNKGTTAIENTLAGHLKTRTVEPPLERTTGFTQATVLAGWAQRDSDGLPDLGYHFDPLDFCWSGLSLNNAAVTLTNGVALGLYGAAGLHLGQGSKLISEGTPQAPNRIVQPALVQENYAHAWLALSPSMTLLKVSGAYGTRPEIRCRFTEFAVPASAWDQTHWLDCRQTPSTSPTYPLNAIALMDCQLWNVRVSLYPVSGTAGSVTAELVNQGSRSAGAAGLWHHTTLANETKDGVNDATKVDVGFHYVARVNNLPADSDTGGGDGLPDWFEDANGDGSVSGDVFNYTVRDTDGDGLRDLQDYELQWNVLVNDPAQDYGNEQNTQFESTCAVINGNVIVAFVDANQGVYGFGHFWESYPDLPTPQFVGYSLSRDGGATFVDKGHPPLSTQGAGTTDDGDAGDPVLAIDRFSGAVYLAGTSSRNQGWKGIPLWKSTDGGASFGAPLNVRTDIVNSDKPWIAVDNGAGSGRQDVYLTCLQNYGLTRRMWLTVSANGSLDNWTTDPSCTHIRTIDEEIAPGLKVTSFGSPIVVIDGNHVGYVFWFERTSDGKNWLRVRKAQNRGTALGTVYPVQELRSTYSGNGNLRLKRTDDPVVPDDTFNAYPFPVVAVNPASAQDGELYVVYADLGEAAGDNADIYFLRSNDHGESWPLELRRRVNGLPEVADRDQWMPMLAVKPEGTQLLVAWYDRRNDSNNSLIEVFARWGTIASNGAVSFGPEFMVSTANFPPVFAGTLPGNEAIGQYDPVYPPESQDLTWHYGSQWPEGEWTFPTWRGHVGEYDGAWAESQYVYVSWTDNRRLFYSQEPNAVVPRNNRDICLTRISWPQ